MKRNTAILVGIALLCGVGVTIVELGPQRVRQQQQLQAQQLLTVTAEEVEGLEIEEGNLAVSLVKDDSDRWQLLEPVEAPAEPLVVQSIITVLTSADAPAITGNTDASSGLEASTNEDTFSPDELEAFGLSTPQQTIVLRHAGGTSTIRVGGLTFDDTGQYLQVDDGPVRVLDIALTSQLSTSLFALRDKSLVDWTPDLVQALTVIGPDETVELDQQEGNWQLSDRPDVLLSDEAIADTLSQTQYLQASQFVAETQENLAEYGLETPSLQIEVTLTDGSTQTISIGEPVPGTPTARHAMSSERAGIVAIEASTLEAIATTELDLRDRSLGQLSSALIGEIAISSSDLSQDITLSPSTAPDTTADQWDVSGQSDRTIAIEEFLIPLQDARANSFLPVDDPTATSLLDSSAISIRVSPVEGVANDPLTLEFAPGDEVLYVRTSHIPDEILTLDLQYYELLIAAIGTLAPSS
ncbi:MAG: DUF4340 domain-containing protein [Cyanobacteria bacterium J06597_1]